MAKPITILGCRSKNVGADKVGRLDEARAALRDELRHRWRLLGTELEGLS